MAGWAPISLIFYKQKITKKKKRRKEELGIEFGHVDKFPGLTKIRGI